MSGNIARERAILALPLLIASLLGCGYDMHPIPRNADPAEKEALALLKPLAGSIAWNANGNVTVLVLAGVSITPEVIEAIQQLRHLEILDLIGTELTDGQVLELTELKNLNALDLSFTDITDQAIGHLATMETLRVLVLDYTTLTNNSLEKLSRMSQLNRLFIAGTNISPCGFDKLRHALPNCLIRTVRFPSTPSRRIDETESLD